MKYAKPFILASLLMVAGQVYAGQERHYPRNPGVNHRQHYQQQRIKQGVKSGQLTREEASTLHQQEKSVRQEKRTFKSDGQLSKGERKDLHQDLNNLSKEIYQEKHDGEVRPNAVK